MEGQDKLMTAMAKVLDRIEKDAILPGCDRLEIADAIIVVEVMGHEEDGTTRGHAMTQATTVRDTIQLGLLERGIDVVRGGDGEDDDD